MFGQTFNMVTVTRVTVRVIMLDCPAHRWYAESLDENASRLGQLFCSF